MHYDDAFAATTMFGGRIAHGMLTAGFISTMVGMELPGPGTIYLGQTLQFRAPVRPGDDVRVVVEVTGWDPERRRATLATTAFVGETRVVVGEAKVIAPA
jgi:3-hydroxybutyryl-CoA dehydratase